MARQRFHCATCDAVRPFEQPPCVDDHDRDCPEWVCTKCGGAILVAPISALAVHLPGRQRGQTAAQRRRAA